MDRRELQGVLIETNRQIAEGERDIARQREVIAGLERDGHDTAPERDLLKRFEEMQALHTAMRDQYLLLMGMLPKEI